MMINDLIQVGRSVSGRDGGVFTGLDPNVKKPSWLRQKAPQGEKYEEVETFTVCEEAQCPNIGEAAPHSRNQTVVVENPMSVDKSGKLVSNVVVGVTTVKKAIK